MAPHTIDYNRISIELLKQIRGRKSQGVVNRNLGYKYNQCSKWETGSSAIRWTDFVRVCKFLQKNLKGILFDTFTYQGQPKDTGKFLEFLFASQPVHKLSSLLDRNPDQIRRWRRSPANITLPIILECIDKLNKGQIFTFLRSFMSAAQIEAILPEVKTRLEEERMTYDDPNISLIPYALELSSYKNLSSHSDQFIADQIDISVKAVQEGLNRLLTKGLVRLESKHYVANRDDHIDLGHDLISFRKLMSFHLGRAKHRVDHFDPSKVRGFFNVFCINKVGLEAVNDLHRQFYSQLVELVQKHTDQPTDVVTVSGFLMENVAAEPKEDTNGKALRLK